MKTRIVEWSWKVDSGYTLNCIKTCLWNLEFWFIGNGELLEFWAMVWESDMTEWLHFLFSLSCIGEGNGNPLQFLAWRIPGTGEPGISSSSMRVTYSRNIKEDNLCNSIIINLRKTKTKQIYDFPSGPVVKTSPSNAGGTGLIPGQGFKITHASCPKKRNIKQKQFNKDFKNSSHQKKKEKKERICSESLWLWLLSFSSLHSSAAWVPSWHPVFIYQQHRRFMLRIF